MCLNCVEEAGAPGEKMQTPGGEFKSTTFLLWGKSAEPLYHCAKDESIKKGKTIHEWPILKCFHTTLFGKLDSVNLYGFFSPLLQNNSISNFYTV